MSDAQGEQRAPVDAAGDILKAAAIEKAAALSLNVAAAKLKKLNRLVRKAAIAINNGDYKEAGQLALKSLDIDPENPLANQIAAIAMDRLGTVELALKLYLRALEFDPHNQEIYENLGLMTWRMQKLEQAERFFRLQLQLDPRSINAQNNLGCVLRDQGRYNDAVEVLRGAIYMHPEAAILWTAMGATMMEQSMTREALQFHNEAARLAPDSSRIQHNLGYTHVVRGEPESALTHFERARELGNLPRHEQAVSDYARGLALVSVGRLREGWDVYKEMHGPYYMSGTRYLIKDMPEWKDDDPLEGKKVLLMGEQGLGDEVLFMSMAHDIKNKLLGPDGKLGISCERRLVSLFQRSFPDAEVMPHATKAYGGGTLRAPKPQSGMLDFDYWMRMSTPLRMIRNEISDFQSPPEGFLKPDPERVAHWKSVLDEMGPGLKCGLLWKSKVMTANRLKNYAAFDLWEPVLTTPGVTWINLQYGETEDEIKAAKDKFGVDIKTLPGLDLMNDLDDLAALGQAIDISMGPSNATLNLTAGAGGEIWLVAPKGGWTLLGQDRYLWYPNVELFLSPDMESWDVAIADMAEALSKRSEKHAAA